MSSVLFFAHLAECAGNVNVVTTRYATMGRMRATALDLMWSVRHLSFPFISYLKVLSGDFMRDPQTGQQSRAVWLMPLLWRHRTATGIMPPFIFD
jgi:hypothetical protein